MPFEKGDIVYYDSFHGKLTNTSMSNEYMGKVKSINGSYVSVENNGEYIGRFLVERDTIPEINLDNEESEPTETPDIYRPPRPVLDENVSDSATNEVSVQWAEINKIDVKESVFAIKKKLDISGE